MKINPEEFQPWFNQYMTENISKEIVKQPKLASDGIIIKILDHGFEYLYEASNHRRNRTSVFVSGLWWTCIELDWAK